MCLLDGVWVPVCGCVRGVGRELIDEGGGDMSQEDDVGAGRFSAAWASLQQHTLRPGTVHATLNVSCACARVAVSMPWRGALLVSALVHVKSTRQRHFSAFLCFPFSAHNRHTKTSRRCKVVPNVPISSLAEAACGRCRAGCGGRAYVVKAIERACWGTRVKKSV